MSNILFKMDQVTERVRALAFHPVRPWILVSIRTGDIQLWDYRMGIKIETFSEHKCPVRSVCFHPTQPLFVSGGDDHRVIVWNFQQKKPLFTLYGHFDYIRTVEFHNEAPWILSASDDQTIRIWNWQSRTCIATLTGHGNYVNSAHFHPTEPLVISGSSDSTVRIWDISGLRAGTPSASQGTGLAFGLPDDDEFKVVHVIDEMTAPVNAVAFAPPRTDAAVSPLPLTCASAHGNDVYIWLFDEIKVMGPRALSAHTQPVTSILFHPHEKVLLSASEDGTVRVWDLDSKSVVAQISREKCFYTCLAAHPNASLLAAGHSGGFQVFKLNRDRPAYCVDVAIPPAALASGAAAGAVAAAASGNPNALSAIRNLGGAHKIYFVSRPNKLYQLSLRDNKLTLISTLPNGAPLVRSLQFMNANGGESTYFLVTYADNTYHLPVQLRGSDTNQPLTESFTSFRHSTRSVAFISSTRYASLGKSRAVAINSMKGELKHTVAVSNAQALFPAGLGRILIRTTDSLILYDAHGYKVLAKLATTTRAPIKYVVQSPDSKYFALLSRNQVTIVSSKLELLATTMETARVKSAAWDIAGVLVYNTVTHLKYLLPNGDQGVIRTLTDLAYLTHVAGNEVGYLGRRQNYFVINIDRTEYLFKLALWKHRSKDVKRIMQTHSLGISVVAYLHKKGFPDVALHFAKDPRLKFYLALEHGDIAAATQFALEVNDTALWSKLAIEALRQGRHDVAEAAAVRVQDFHRLLFLYVTTGQREKIAQLLEIARHRKDIEGRFEASLYLGDVSERINVLKEAGHKKLAFIVATAHGLAAEAQALVEEIGVDQLPPVQSVVDFFSDSLTPNQTPDWRLLLPRIPLPIFVGNQQQLQDAVTTTDGSAATSWPLLPVKRGFNFDIEGSAEEEAAEAAAAAEFESDFMVLAKSTAEEEMLLWGTQTSQTAPKGSPKSQSPTAAEAKTTSSDAIGWDMDLDIGDLGDADLAAQAEAAQEVAAHDPTGFVMPSAGKGYRSNWNASTLAVGELFAAGEFDQAMHLLQKQIGATKFDAFKPYVLASANHVEARLRTCPYISNGFMPVPVGLGSPLRPRTRFTRAAAQGLRETMLTAMTQADLASVRRTAEMLLAQIPLISLQNEISTRDPAQFEQAEAELLSIVRTAREYLLLVILDAARNQAQDPVRKAELSAFCTHLELEPIHQVITLWLGCKYAYGAQAYRVVASFCRRLLTLSATTNLDVLAGKVKIEQVRLMLRKCESVEQPDQVELKYNPNVAFGVCARSLQQISGARAAEGREVLVCGYCGAKHAQSCMGEICAVCDISKLGLPTTGLRLVPEHLK